MIKRILFLILVFNLLAFAQVFPPEFIDISFPGGYQDLAFTKGGRDVLITGGALINYEIDKKSKTLINWLPENGSAEIYFDTVDNKTLMVCGGRYTWHKPRYKSTDLGISWQEMPDSQTICTSNPLNPNILWGCKVIYNSDNELYKSYDKGESWNYVRSFSSYIYKFGLSYALTDTSWIYFNADDGIYLSRDGGNNWVFRDLTMYPYGGKIWVNPYNKRSIIFARDGRLFKSKDAGITIKLIWASELADFVVSLTDTNTIVLCQAAYPAVNKSTDEGNSWHPISPETLLGGGRLYANPYKPNELFMGILFSTDFGDTWEVVNCSSGPSDMVYADFPVAGKVFASTTSYRAGMFASTNYGASWFRPMDFFADSVKAYIPSVSMNPFNPDDGLLVDHFQLYRTVDAGISWDKIRDFNYSRYVVHHPLVENLIYLSTIDMPAGSSVIHVSDDKGETWSMTNILPWYEGIWELQFHNYNPDIIYGRRYQSVVKTTDRGNSWIKINNGLLKVDGATMPPKKITMRKDSSNVLYCIQIATMIPGRLSKTTDGGNTWFQIDQSLLEMDGMCDYRTMWLDPRKPGRMYVGLMSYKDKSNIAGRCGGLYLTEDDGKSWRRIFAGSVNMIVADNSEPANIYVSTSCGLVRFIDTLTVTGVDEKERNHTPQGFALMQNYPNPFNPGTKILYSLENEALVRLKVFDVLGNEVSTLVNEYKSAGSYEYDFNAQELSSGVYFYQLQVCPGQSGKNSFIETRKMILLR